MSAKHSKKKANKPASETTVPAPAAQLSAAVPAGAGAAAVPAGESTAWIDSSDPRKRMIGKIVFIAVWIYVGALWLLALDQTFHWGIFGPKVSAVP